VIFMTEQMTHRERVRAAINGREFDRVPVSMWRHFYADETTAEGLAEAMLGFQREYDWDFMKVNPRASYHAEGWGMRTVYESAGPKVVETPIKSPEDWLRIEPLSLETGPLAEQLRALELVNKGLNGEIPWIMTVFTPMSVAADLAPSEAAFVKDLREHPDNVRAAMEAVTETFINFSRACLDRGASGLFYATTSWATSDAVTEAEYRALAVPYDLKVLQGLPATGFTLLHICRDRNFLPLFRDYPVHAVSWDARAAANPSLAEGMALLGGKAAVGGMGYREDLVKAPAAQAAGEVIGLRTALGRQGWMIGPGCTFPGETPAANLKALREAVARPLPSR
jgi:uroporphyrinogen decarboxylase